MLTSLVLSMALAAVDGKPATAATAPRAGCIELKTVAQIEEAYVNDKGERAVRLVPAAKVIPGSQVVWTVTAANVCAQPAANVLIANPLPEHMNYVDGSAVGAGAEIAFSLDGRQFAAPDALLVREADGKDRPARADEYKHIRWTFRNPIAPGQLAIARYRATLK